MQYAIGEHALLADSRTAALIDPGGGVAWCCWPRFDSPPLFMSLLDESSGGELTVRPESHAAVESRAYVPGTLVLRTAWRLDQCRLIVDDTLVPDGRPTLLRALRAEGGPVVVRVRVRPPAVAGGRPLRVDQRRLVVDGPAAVQLIAPAAWSSDREGATSRFAVSPGAPVTITLTPAGESGDVAAGAIELAVQHWRARLAGVAAVQLRPDAEAALGARRCRELLSVSAAVLSGLRYHAGGIVAAPTTSLPQWPRSARCWDYRYCWLRDSALACAAMLRLELVDAAVALGEFIGTIVAESGVRPLVRIDGGDPPEERADPGIAGYGGARPVRFGNAAAGQLQLDVAGEVLELADILERAGALPPALAASVAPLASWIADRWHTPDHGIWEIRGTPRQYTHSRVMGWLGLDRAAGLAERGRVPGDASRWRALAERIRAATVPAAGALQLTGGGSGGDAALAVAVQNGFLDPAGPTAAATLDLIERDLDDDGLLQRYRGSRDPLTDPCAPFVFPTFWMATAAARAGRDGGRWLQAAAATAGPLGLLGEVRDPESGGPYGNYPQVQSHAALVLALTADPSQVSSRW